MCKIKTMTLPAKGFVTKIISKAMNVIINSSITCHDRHCFLFSPRIPTNREVWFFLFTVAPEKGRWYLKACYKNHRAEIFLLCTISLSVSHSACHLPDCTQKEQGTARTSLRHAQEVYSGATDLNFTPTTSTEKIFQERESTACTSLLWNVALPVTLQYCFSDLCSWPPPTHTTLESDAMKKQPVLELCKAKPGRNLPTLEVSGFGVAQFCEEELNVIAGTMPCGSAECLGTLGIHINLPRSAVRQLLSVLAGSRGLG